MRSVDVVGKRDCKQGTLLRAACDELFRFLIRVELCFRHDGVFAGVVRIDLEVCDGRYIATLFRHDEGCDVRVIRSRCDFERHAIHVLDCPAIEHIPFAGVRGQGDGLVLEDLRDVGLAVYRGCGGAHRAVIHADVHRAPCAFTEIRNDRHCFAANDQRGACPVAGRSFRADGLNRIAGQQLAVFFNRPALEPIPVVPLGTKKTNADLLARLDPIRAGHICAEGYGGSARRRSRQICAPRDFRAFWLKIGLEGHIITDRKHKGVAARFVFGQLESARVRPSGKLEFQHAVGRGARDGRCGYGCVGLCLLDDVSIFIFKDDAAHCDTGYVGLIEGRGCTRQRIAGCTVCVLSPIPASTPYICCGHGKREAVCSVVYRSRNRR